MNTPTDPGWRPAWRIALRIVGLRRPEGTLLTVLRAAVIFLCGAAVVTGVLGVVLTRGVGAARVSATTARIVLIAAALAAMAVVAVTRAELPDLRGPGHLAVWLFASTMRRILAGAAVGPVGFLLSWMGHTGVHAVVASIAAIVLMATAAPTARRVERWQVAIRDAGSEIDVLEALSLPYQ